MVVALFLAFCLGQHPPVKCEATVACIKQVEKIEQPDLIKWNLQSFYDALQRDDRTDMNKFAERSIQLLNQHKVYRDWVKLYDKDEYFKLMNLKKVIPPPLKVEAPKEIKSGKKMPLQQPAVKTRRYTIPGEQIPKHRDNLPGNRRK